MKFNATHQKHVIKVKALNTADIKELCLYPASIMTEQISRDHLATVFILQWSIISQTPSFSKRQPSHREITERENEKKKKNLSQFLEKLDLKIELTILMLI